MILKKLFAFSLLSLSIGLVFLGCKKTESLKLPGTWKEQAYSYSQPTSTFYDTTNYTLKDLQFDCTNAFQLVLTTHHKVYDGDSALGSKTFCEYVKGVYTAVDYHLILKGIYYTDSTFTIVSDSVNTRYAHGSYLWESDYKIDNQRLTIGLNTSSRNDLNTFIQTRAFECF